MGNLQKMHVHYYFHLFMNYLKIFSNKAESEWGEVREHFRRGSLTWGPENGGRASSQHHGKQVRGGTVETRCSGKQDQPYTTGRRGQLWGWGRVERMRQSSLQLKGPQLAGGKRWAD